MIATEKPGRRGRPRSFDVDVAVETAMRLFHARGYDAVGVAELVAALGIKPPSFYAAFGSKAGVFARALERYAAGEGNVFARALAEGGGVAGVISRMLGLAAAIYPSADFGPGCLVLEGARESVDPEARGLAEAAVRRSWVAVRDFIATEAPGKADGLADFVMVVLRGMSAAARDGVDAAALRGVAEVAGRVVQGELSLADRSDLGAVF